LRCFGQSYGFFLTGDEVHDLIGFDALFPSISAKAFLADKAYDAQERVIDKRATQRIAVVIAPKANRIIQRDYDKDLYKARHLIENFFCKLKQYRAIATRCDKTKRNFLGGIYLPAAIIWPH
jgi:transposase